jgi:hypothetical protein
VAVRLKDQIHGLAGREPAETGRSVKIALQRRRDIEPQILLRRGGGNGDCDFHDELESGDERYEGCSAPAMASSRSYCKPRGSDAGPQPEGGGIRYLYFWWRFQ